MARIVHCVVLKEDAEGLEKSPHPGELGQRIFENVSREGWKQWLERLTTIINENGLTTSDIKHIELIEKHMLGFFFRRRRLRPVTGRLSGGRRQEIVLVRGRDLFDDHPEKRCDYEIQS